MQWLKFQSGVTLVPLQLALDTVAYTCQTPPLIAGLLV